MILAAAAGVLFEAQEEADARDEATVDPAKTIAEAPILCDSGRALRTP